MNGISDRAHGELDRHREKIAALLKGSSAILKYRKFEDAARAIFDSCKDFIGATSGYVALLSPDGTENEVLFLDSGGLPCTVDTKLPMPIRGLRAEAYHTGKTVYNNDFSNSKWQQYMPSGHMRLENVLFAPLILDGKAVGLLGLANKPDGFNEYDTETASAFGELAAVALLNSRTIELLETSEKKYHNLVDNAPVGVYQSNLRGDILYANKALLKIFEFESSDDFLSEGAISRYKNPKDRQVLTEKLKETGKIEGFETAVITKSGKTKNVLLSATLDSDILSGMVMDITDRKQAEEKLLKSHSELSALYDISSAISRTIDMDKLINNILNTITGLDILNIERKGGIFIVEDERMTLVSHLGHSEVFLNSHKNMKIGDCLCGLAAKTGAIIISRNSDEDSRHTFRYHDMTPHGHIILPLKAKDKVVGVLYLYLPADVEIGDEELKILVTAGDQIGIAVDHARLYEETKALSLQDSLTGLANRRLMGIMLETNLSVAKRFKKPLSVIMADIDCFKSYNDTFGHIAGDKILVEIASILLKEIRGVDLAVRYGGEEFFIMLTETDLAGAREAAERIRKAVSSATGVTISLGAASYHKGTKNKEDLIRKADSALYKAKQKGRNRVEAADV